MSTTVTGGTITEVDEYTLHTFTSSGDLEVSGEDIEAEYLIVAGGGGGGASSSGSRGRSGGGAGGVLTNAGGRGICWVRPGRNLKKTWLAS